MYKKLSKKVIIKVVDTTSPEFTAFDENIKKLTIVNEITANSVNIKASENVTGFFVLAVFLKRQDYDKKVIEKIFKRINQRLILVLQHEDMAQLAVFHGKLFTSEWQPTQNLQIKLQGLNFAQVWQNIILQISKVQLEKGRTLDEQLVVETERAKLQRQIEILNKKIKNEKQPPKVFEMVKQVKQLKSKLEVL